MGFISDTYSAGKATPPTSARDGRAAWRELFATNKEDQHNGPYQGKTPVPGGSYGRSITGSDASIKRLLQAMKSMAPGGWSDDRWEQSRHMLGMTYVAIHRCGEQLGQAEFQVFKKDDNHQDGKRPVSKRQDPEAYKLVELLEKPNDDDSFGDMMYQANQQLDLTGMWLDWMVPNKLGTPYQLYTIPTATAIPQPAVNPDFPDGYYRIQPVYPYGPFSSYPTPASAVGAPIPAQWMLRVKYHHPLLRYEGYSPQTALRSQIDQLESIDRSRWYSMKRSINPSAVLNFDEMEGAQALPEAEILRIVATWENEFQGSENTGKLIVGAPGGKLEQWGSRPMDMDYPAGWNQISSFVLAGFGITKPAAGMTEDASYSNLFASLKQLYWLTLEPKCNRIAAKLTRHLAPFFGDDLIIEIRCKPINDHEITAQKIDKGIQAKCITKNEVRKMLEMPVTKEEWGEEIAGQEEQEQQEGMPGMAGPGGDGSGPGQEGEQQGDEDTIIDTTEDEQAPETERERPNPGNLNQGALGPRQKAFKALRDKYKKRMSYQTNGVH